MKHFMFGSFQFLSESRSVNTEHPSLQPFRPAFATFFFSKCLGLQVQARKTSGEPRKAKRDQTASSDPL